MLNRNIQQKILTVLNGAVLSTSMVARKTNLSRITVSKYLNALAGKNVVQAVRIGKAVAWRAAERKPLIAIISKTGTARVIKLALGDSYNCVLGTNMHGIRDADVLITDNKLLVKNAGMPVILVGAFDDQAYNVPELFDTILMKALVKKLIDEQKVPDAQPTAVFRIEHIDEFEVALGVDSSDEIITLFHRLLRENHISFKQYERTTFLIEGIIPDSVLTDIEHCFHLLLSHIYGRMVMPGEEISHGDNPHIVPSLSIAVSVGLVDDPITES